MLPPFKLEQAINALVREEWGRILASLVKSIGDLQLAEDCLQDAVEKALDKWLVDGLPESPAGWLIQTARRGAIDRFRRDANFARMQPEISYLLDLANQEPEFETDAIPDKRLELIFTCCHPALEEKSRIALTLRTLCGLTTDEIAKTFLDNQKTMAQRLVRAKKKIAAAGIPYAIPEATILPERLNTVLSVIYLIFNEGYAATKGKTVSRADLTEEAIRLARITQQLMPDQAEVSGLLALMLLHDSRRFARQSKDGQMIALEDQDRRTWDRQKIQEGTELIKRTLLRQQVGSYQLQAAISALHAEANTWEETDWPQISALYTVLYTIQPSPVIRINQAVAVSYADTATAGLKLLDDSVDAEKMQHYQPYHAARADLLFRTGACEAARTHLQKAIELTDNEAERAFLEKKLLD